ncbi:uncharacterized protein F5891DRAFT_1187510 [Suillus fuscotomentosus]|uniref:Uncharacterized protein n=1 Tax=Suillus fuscotomentosus TaxID=1912939 RepID=A0AAD4HMG6_9AGAM|nr:uncharacterized protein F5891DRAFT_1187510 [Suillus fuscotomentosus]KAG1901631.1 hypothetical protein F5891DRAFT_1187510 [Suillus fuscotomentosus]
MFNFIGNEHSDASVDDYHPDYFATGCSECVADHGSFSGAQQTAFMDTLYPPNHGPSTLEHSSSYQNLIPFDSARLITCLSDLLNSDVNINWEDPALYANLPPFSELMYENTSTWQVPDGFPQLPSAHSREELPPTPNTQVPTPDNSTFNSKSSADSRPSDVEAVATGKNSSWAARNPGRPVLTTHQGEAVLNDAVKSLATTYADMIEKLADEHSVTTEKVKLLLGCKTFYKNKQGPTLHNAIVHVKALELNEGRPMGAKYTLEKKDYILKLKEHRMQQCLSVCATNLAASKDAQVTLDKVFKELEALALHTGMYVCLFATHGHVYDTNQAMWFGTDNVMYFWEDVLSLQPDYITKQLELWGCNQNKNINERDSVENMQRQSKHLLESGFNVITKGHNICMVYMNFETSIKEKHGINIKGWPENVLFTSPYKIGTVDKIRSLHHALQNGTCHWVNFTPHQHQEHIQHLDARHKAGETVRAPRKKHSDAGVSCKHRSAKEKVPPSKRVRSAVSNRRPAPKSVEYIDSTDNDEDSLKEDD